MKLLIASAISFGIALISDLVFFVRGVGEIEAGRGYDRVPDYVVIWLFVSIAVILVSGTGLVIALIRKVSKWVG